MKLNLVTSSAGRLEPRPSEAAKISGWVSAWSAPSAVCGAGALARSVSPRSAAGSGQRVPRADRVSRILESRFSSAASEFLHSFSGSAGWPRRAIKANEESPRVRREQRERIFPRPPAPVLQGRGKARIRCRTSDRVSLAILVLAVAPLAAQPGRGNPAPKSPEVSADGKVTL